MNENLQLTTTRCNLCNEILPEGWTSHRCGHKYADAKDIYAYHKPLTQEQWNIGTKMTQDIRKAVDAHILETAQMVAAINERINALDKKINDMISMPPEMTGLFRQALQQTEQLRQSLSVAIGRIEK